MTKSHHRHPFNVEWQVSGDQEREEGGGKKEERDLM